MRRLAAAGLFAGLLMLGLGGPATAQEGQELMDAGETAPDIEFTGATRYGVISGPLSLSDFRGETVVLAFFFKARTGG